ncbi:MAG TPA: ectoine hydroxylase [Pseudonocardiaceae bacterium]|nr:ectoine hydroxylase [Pseudonocardiaceae bacterium]
MTLVDETTVPESRQDMYPTRLEGQPTPMVRPDPTVWPADSGERPAGPFDAAALAAYNADGCAIVQGLLSPAEVGSYSAELARLTSDESLATDERSVVEKESREIRSIFAVHEISPLIAELVRDPRVVDRARQVLGSDVYVHQSRINYMPGFRGRGFYWHSDFETWHAEDGMATPRACSMSIALTDNHPFNGGLMVMPGSHRTYVPCAGATPEDHYQESLREQEIGVPSESDLTALATEHGIAQFTGPAGDALLFDSNIMHGSGNNITPMPRSNIFVVFNSVHNALGEPYSAPRPRPEFVASRDFTPVGR